MARGCALRRWCGALRKKTTWTCGRVAGTGSAGRITKEDVLKYLAGGLRSAVSSIRRQRRTRG
jgi:pyruvate/2-oxoglutarate dehydrogenase complex dihydrolipoamide acyltransferase (E2) component